MKKFNYIKNNKEEAIKYLLNIEKSFNELEKINFKKYDSEDTAIVHVDTINGFFNEGALASPRAKNIVEPIKTLIQNTQMAKHLYLVDTHTKDSVEFRDYPEHCLTHTNETKLIKEIFEDEIDPYFFSNEQLIPKNNINGFLAPAFSKWLEKNKDFTTFIIVGLVTDICVMNFALTLKGYFNENNINSNIIVPVNGVETFTLDATNHQGDLMNIFALYNMQMNGIQLIQI